jgi:hypothetical protein
VQTFLWWRGGDSLAHLLLANLDEGWLEGEELPGWAQDLDSIAGPHPSFVQSTQHCSAALLLPREQEPDAPVYFEQALYGGSPRVGLDAANKNDVTAAKAVWKDHIDAAALGNPRVPRFVDPKTSVVRAGFGLSPELAHLQNLLSWYRQNRRPELARGVLRAHDGQLDALVLDVKLSGSYPEIKQAVWFALGREFADLTDEQYNRMTSYLEDIPNNAQMRLTYAVRGALPRAPKSAQDAIAEAVIERFYIDAESALEAAFSSVLEGAPYSPDTVATLRTLMVGAFNHVLAPYISVRTLADIAHEGGVLARAHLGPAPEKASAKGKK